jgi:hypothetical protein
LAAGFFFAAAFFAGAFFAGMIVTSRNHEMPTGENAAPGLQ